MNKILFFIPARGGSKGLPGKNIKLLGGRPLICWAIKAAKDSGLKGDIVVSSDSNKILTIAKKNGALTPFKRPAYLASDSASTMDVIKHFFEWSVQNGKKYETLIILQPTSPLRTGKDILNAYKDYEKRKCDSVVTVCKSSFKPAWINTLPPDMSMKNFIPKKMVNKNRQEQKIYYEINGAVIVSNFKKVIKSGSVYTSKTYAIEMPSNRSIDIDDEKDFIVAKYWFKKNKKTGNQ
jgi:CMP-N,N'-diacetyllegionaminic acid synthase